MGPRAVKEEADVIVEAISSLECTSETATALQRLLQTTPATVAGKAKENTPSTKRKCAVGVGIQAKTQTRLTIRAKPATTKHEPTSRTLSAGERHVLATDVFNRSLKAFNVAIRAESRPSQKSPNRQALQQSSTNSPERKAPRITEEGPDAAVSINIIAECAYLAVRVLISNDAQACDSQLNAGLSVLIGRLLSLGMVDAAARQLRILKSRLELPMSATTVMKSRATTTKNRSPSTKDNPTASLLKIGSSHGVDESLPSLVAYQLQVLRLLATCGNSQTIEAALPYILHSNTGSAFSRLTLLAEGRAAGAKVAQQLDQLSRLLLSLCPSVASATDNVARDSARWASPKSIFTIQTVALEARVTWWAAVEHTPDIQKELWQPLAKCGSAYLRRTESRAAEAYNHVKHSFEAVRQRSAGEGYEDEYDAAVLTVLSDAAEAALIYDDAMGYVNALKGRLRQGASATELAVVTVRSATLSFRSDCTDLSDRTGEAIMALKGDLVGRAQDQDALLATVMAWRKAASQGVAKCSGLESTGGEHDPKMTAKLQAYCSAIFASAAFVPRYIGSHQPGVESAAQRSQTRATLGMKALESVLDSLAACVESVAGSLDVLQKALHDCYGALEQLSTTSLNDGLQKIRLRLSRVCWSSYAIGRSRSPCKQRCDPSLMEILDLCVKVLRGSGSQVQQDGAYVLRLERFAIERMSLQQYSHAAELLQEAVERLVSDGALAGLVARLRKAPLAKAWKDDKTTAKLSSMLSLLTRAWSRLGISENVVFALSEDSPVEEVSALLEWDLMTTKTLTAVRLNDLANRLLDLYDPTSHPLRRLRVSTAVLHKALSTGTHLNEHVLRAADSCVIPSEKSLAQDSGLAPYSRHYEACYAAARAFLDPVHSVGLLRSALQYSMAASAMDDIDVWLAQLQEIADYFSIHGPAALRIKALEAMLQALDVDRSLDSHCNERIRIHLDLTDCHSLGENGNAALLHLGRAEALALTPDAKLESRIAVAIASARCHLEIANVEVCRQKLNEVCAFGVDCADSAVARKQALPPLCLNTLRADAALVASKYCIGNGHTQDAIVYAKQALKLNQRRWATVEAKHSDRETTAYATSCEESSSRHKNLSHNSLSGPRFWGCVPGLFESQMQCGVVMIHIGQWQEAIYHVEQAERIATAVGSNVMLARATALLLRYHVGAGRVDKTEERVETLAGIPHELLDPGTIALIRLEQGRVLAAKGESELARQHWDDAVKLSAPRGTEDLDGLSSDMKRLVIAPKTEDVQSKPRKGARSKLKRAQPTAIATSYSQIPRSSYHALHSEVLATRALMLLPSGDPETAQRALQELKSCGNYMDPLRLITLHSAEWVSVLKTLETDLEYGTLSESTLAIPAVTVHRAKPNTAPRARGKQRVKKSPPKHGLTALQCVHKNLEASIPVILSESSNGDVRHLSRSYLNTSLLLTSAGSTTPGLAETQLTSLLALPNNMGLSDEYSLLAADAMLSGPAARTTWPRVIERRDFGILDVGCDFTCDAMLPSSWTVISLNLNTGNDELLVSRHDFGRTPFLMRLPMRRQRSREDEDDTFTFEDGQSELRDIIGLSDASTQDTRNMTAKGAKRQWWTEREALDSRLRDLLVNIEHIWFGGFKSVFATRQDDAGLQQLEIELLKALDNHLPSRRAKGSPAWQFDTRLIELFAGLGPPASDDFEFANDLTDLLYLLVDVLHLNGEHNAFDEIDFDALAVDVLDALKTYHGHKTTSSHDQHLILILDKALHGFPWESMPCLQGRPVSRLPSMQALHDRLTLLREQNDHVDYALRVGRQGTSILNPSGDLTDTEANLRPYLQQLASSWTQHVGPVPGDPLTEGTMLHALRSSDLFCYYGHGSTAQYIRPRAVRKLYKPHKTREERVRCPVSLLMGCSSAAVTENGEYHPHGMMFAYLTAGAPAVAGCLWDVTDRDCDRFSIECGRRWGLWTAGTSPQAQKGKTTSYEVEGPRRMRAMQAGKPNQQAGSSEQTESASEVHNAGKETLSQAVASSRDVCYLKYLNGAAMVVYGIPVILE